MDKNQQLQIPGSSSFTKISVVPDYRAFQMIQQQKEKLQSILTSDCNPVLQSISKDDSYRRFIRTLGDVEQYLKSNPVVANDYLNQEQALTLTKLLRENFSLTPTEIVMVLNQMPTDESMLDLMFGGKFGKEQSTLMIQIIKHFLPVKNNIKDGDVDSGHIDKSMIMPKEEIEIDD